MTVKHQVPRHTLNEEACFIYNYPDGYDLYLLAPPQCDGTKITIRYMTGSKETANSAQRVGFTVFGQDVHEKCIFWTSHCITSCLAFSGCQLCFSNPLSLSLFLAKLVSAAKAGRGGATIPVRDKVYTLRNEDGYSARRTNVLSNQAAG